MQMREGKYIRFDFTQASRTRTTSAERRDYRIIARTRPLIVRRRERSRAPLTLLQRSTRSARKASAQWLKQVRSSPDFPIYCAGLQDSRLLVQKHGIAVME
jgi:hypothetical protein